MNPQDKHEVETVRGCPVRAGAIHGGEAEELRSGIETLLEQPYDLTDDPVEDLKKDLQALLERVDARDSLAQLQSQGLDEPAARWAQDVDEPAARGAQDVDEPAARGAQDVDTVRRLTRVVWQAVTTSRNPWGSAAAVGGDYRHSAEMAERWDRLRTEVTRELFSVLFEHRQASDDLMTRAMDVVDGLA